MRLSLGIPRAAWSGMAILTVLLAAGCSSGSAQSGSGAQPAGGGAQPAAQPSASPTGITVPAGALAQAGTIRYCSDISSPPLEFYANGQTPTGSDVDLGNAIAAELGVQAQWVNTAFAGIVPALQAGHCDAIISQLFDKAARRKVVDFTDYMNSSEAIMVRKGNPAHITGLAGLCGQHVAAETGTTVTDFLTQQSKKCTAAGKQPIAVQTFLRDSDALSQLALGHVAAYGTTVETGGYDISKASGMFQLAGAAFGKQLTGIATSKNDTALRTAIAAALAALQRNGKYQQIMTKWNLKPDMLGQS